jgi:hypothetical protein
MTGNVILDHGENGKLMPVNPLSWWHMQQLAGEEHNRLTQMAVDALSTPG